MVTFCIQTDAQTHIGSICCNTHTQLRYLPHVSHRLVSPWSCVGNMCVCIHASTHMCVCVNQKWVTSDTDKSLYGPQGCIIHSSSSLYFYLLLPLHPLSPHSCVGPVESGMWSATWSKQRGKSLGIFVLNDHAVLSLGPLSLCLCFISEWSPLLIHLPTSHNEPLNDTCSLIVSIWNNTQSIVRLADGSVS